MQFKGSNTAIKGLEHMSPRADSVNKRYDDIKVEFPRPRTDAKTVMQTSDNVVMSLRVKSDTANELSIGESTKVATGGRHTRHKEMMQSGGILSGRMPDITGGPFSTLETIEQQTIDSQRNQANSAMSNFLLGSPSNAIYKREGDWVKTSGRASANQPVSRTMLKRNMSRASNGSVAKKTRSIQK